MFTYDDLYALLHSQPFVPFRLRMSDGDAVEVRHPELVAPGRRYAIIGLPDPARPDRPFDRHTVVWYMHVTRAELIDAGPPPFSAPPGTETTTPSPA